jgi:hypothetical protein
LVCVSILIHADDVLEARPQPLPFLRRDGTIGLLIAQLIGTRLGLLLASLEQVFAQLDLAATSVQLLAALLQPVQDGAFRR